MTPKQRLNILLADDGSQHAQAAVEWLQSISLPPNSHILVFHVFHSGQIEFVPDFERSLERTKKQLSGRGYCVGTELQLGHAAEKILEIAAARSPDLIVLGAKGLRSTVSVLLGGVAQHVVECACCPVLIVRAPYQGFCRVLFVTDGSMASQHAACYLANFPLPGDAHVSLMHVLPPMHTPVMMEPYFDGTWQTIYAVPRAPQEEESTRERETKLGEALLTRTHRLLQQYGFKAAPVLVRGDAATEILDYARENQTDLIVAGSRGLSQFKSLWMGSVSRKLVHYSNCSVLIVKPPEKE